MASVRRDGSSFLDLNVALSPCDLFKTLSKAPLLGQINRATPVRRSHQANAEEKTCLGRSLSSNSL